MAENWDNFLILDACRYDIFKERITKYDFKGKLESRKSRGSDTVEWLWGNIHGRSLTNTVYVTANPQYHRIADAEFHDVINVWQHDEAIHDKFNAVMPEAMYEWIIDAANQYPHKRILAHFVQPHYPFIGPTGREYFDNDGLQFWQRIFLGELTHINDDILWKAYVENVDEVLQPVKRLTEELEGRTIVSADHGQVFNERASPIPIREYGHPRHMRMENLITVPWLIIDGNRREIYSEKSIPNYTTVGDEGIRNRLEALGYR